MSPQIVSYGDFHFDSLRLVDHSQVPWTSLSDIWVLPQCLWLESRVIVTAEPVPWSIFVRFDRPTVLPSKSKSDQQRRSRVPIDEDILLQLQLEFPWLTLAQLREMLEARTSVVVGGGGQTGSSNPGPSSRSARSLDYEVAEDVVARVQAELRALRDELAQSDDSLSYFRIRVLGGEWSLKRSGKTTTDVGCYAKDKSTKNWCDVVAWPSARSFAVGKFGGVQNARMLSEEVRRKGDYFINAWVDPGSPLQFSFDDCKQGYRTTDEYYDWMDSLALNSWGCKAAFEIRDMCPRPVPP